MFRNRFVWLSALTLSVSACAAAPPNPAQTPEVATPAPAASGAAPPSPAPVPEVAPDAAATGADPDAAAATTAARAWLSLVDAEKYTESWAAAAKGFQRAVSQADWMKAAAAARGPFGKLASRQLRSATHRSSLPGAPDGNYVIVQFSTAFERKAEAVETVTPVQEEDGTWRVSGYFIK